jgi:alpha-L-arabinofuranosidase
MNAPSIAQTMVVSCSAIAIFIAGCASNTSSKGSPAMHGVASAGRMVDSALGSARMDDGGSALAFAVPSDANTDSPSLIWSATSTLRLTVDAMSRGIPISPYIYGQFIEHLGRSIYGGIWAEMLEDRKFYYSITSDYHPYRSLQNTAYPVIGASPWEIMGKSSGVTMVTAGAFVGAHSARIAAGNAIRQRDLAIVGGKSYSGYVWVRSASSAPGTLGITLAWGEEPSQRLTRRLDVPSGSEFSKLGFHFTSSESSGSAWLELRAMGGDVVVGVVSLMPADNVHGMRSDTLARLKQLKGTVYRWPGGNFASGYEWRDGIGDRDRRPPRANPAWTGVEHNDFGTDEFLAFCREIGAEPAIAVNTGFGDAYSAAQWVEYCNGSARTLAGGWRGRNGHPSPYGVQFWCVGNEMYGAWQLGHMRLEHYTQKHNRFAEAMHSVDPKAVLIGVGDIDGMQTLSGAGDAKREVSWSQGMLEASADHMDLLSEHLYEGRMPWNKDVRGDIATHVGKLRNTIRRKAERHRAMQATLPNIEGRVVPLAVDEWNYWHRDYAYGELGCQYDLADGLGVAAGLHEYFRQTDIIHMAFYAQTVNVLGCIKTSKTAAELETTGLVLQLYREHFGEIPLLVSQPLGPLDASAALSRDGHTLTIGVVNPTMTSLDLPVDVKGAVAHGKATRWVIGGADEFAHNTPGEPRQVDIQRAEGLDTASLALPALSCTVFEISVE